MQIYVWYFGNLDSEGEREREKREKRERKERERERERDREREREISGVAAGATRAALSAHFAT